MEALHLLFQLRDLLLQAGGLGRACQRWLLPIGAVELVQIAGDALLDLSHAPLHLQACEVGARRYGSQRTA
jgi:hypothetical protein